MFICRVQFLGIGKSVLFLCILQLCYCTFLFFLVQMSFFFVGWRLYLGVFDYCSSKEYLRFIGLQSELQLLITLVWDNRFLEMDKNLLRGMFVLFSVFFSGVWKVDSFTWECFSLLVIYIG